MSSKQPTPPPRATPPGHGLANRPTSPSPRMASGMITESTGPLHVLLFEKRFIAPIKSGEKVHTIRPQRRRMITPGAALSLRHWAGVAYRSKQIEIMRATCLDVGSFAILPGGLFVDGELVGDVQAHLFALQDGFLDVQEMIAWHQKNYGTGETRDRIIWGRI